MKDELEETILIQKYL